MGENFLCIPEISLLIIKRRDCQLSKLRGKSITNSKFHISTKENQIRERSQVQRFVFYSEKKKEAFLLFVYIIKYFPSYIYIYIYNSIFLAFIIYPHATAMEENFVHFSMKGISR